LCDVSAQTLAPSSRNALISFASNGRTGNKTLLMLGERWNGVLQSAIAMRRNLTDDSKTN